MSNPLWYLQNTSKEPGLWESDKIQNDNQEYQKEGENFSKQKEDVKNNLYWKFQPEKKQEFNVDPLGLLEETEEQQKYTNQEQNKDLEQENNISSIESDSPYFPILKNLTESWHIEQDVFKEYSLKLNELSKEDGQKEIIELVKTISDSSLKQDILEKFENNTEVDEKNFEKTKFFTDISSLNIDIDSWVGWLEIMLAENYIPIPNIDWGENKDRDVSLCMETVVNTIISNNNKDFRLQNGVLISDIRKESNINKKYTLLKELHEWDLKYDAKAWWKKAKEEIILKQKTLKIKFEKITWEMKKTNKITNNEEREHKLKDLKKEKEQIITEWKDLDVFERETILIWYGLTLNEGVISWWKEDKQNESKEKEPQN